MKTINKAQSKQQIKQMKMNQDIDSLQQNENNFINEIKTLKVKTIINQLQSSPIQNSNSNLNSSTSSAKILHSSPPNIKSKSLEKIMKHRITTQLFTLKNNIEAIEEYCDEQYGGRSFMKQELAKSLMDPQEYQIYCSSMVRRNFKLPTINPKANKDNKLNKPERSKSEQKLKSKQQYNKWYIEPTQRFSKSRDITKYDWRTENFMLNIVHKKDNKLEHQFLPKFIKSALEKLKRQPLLCKYTIVSAEKKR